MNDHKPHVRLLEFNLILFDRLNLDGKNTVVPRKDLVLLGFFADVSFLGTHIVETVVEVSIGVIGILLEEILKVALRVIVRSRQVFGEKDVDGERFGKRGNHAPACFRYGVDVIFCQVGPDEQGHAHHIDQDDHDDIDHELDVFFWSFPGHISSSPPSQRASRKDLKR